MTEQEAAEWQARLNTAVAETVRRRAERRLLREEHQAARNVGLRHRHATRLARARTTPGDTMPTTDDQPDKPMPPCCRDSGHPDGCPQHVQAVYVLEHRRVRRRPHPAPAPTPPDGPEAA